MKYLPIKIKDVKYWLIIMRIGMVHLKKMSYKYVNEQLNFE